ncbi:putative cucumisin [Rosa chinensis]|uniref:Putative cucumisin n=1 Tax=Rosa chinensis TaxID=74649 RepID=A0A2P6SL02_ROSCH|nr:cucumisin [Rosa chinensis]PRQ59339.1 putative cucumisin [Rosa chinensis]
MALRWFPFLSLICSILLLVVDVTHSAVQDARKAYIVYMGNKPKNGAPILPGLHVNMLQDVVDNSNIDIAHEDLLLHSYKRSFNGFAAVLTEQEAQKMIGMDGVVSVFPSKQRSVKTTKSWNFLGFPETVKRGALERDIIVGVIDSGVWPESDSFSDAGFGPPPKKWKGKCQGNGNLTCNNKIIGAKYYRASQSFKEDVESPRDSNGHGTHTASTAAGNTVIKASFNDLGSGTARGGVPSARIAVYKACWGSSGSCDDADVLAAFDDAIADGVDILSVSVGGTIPLDYLNDPFAIGSFHAIGNGILVSMAAGNEGPGGKTVTNFAPWQLSVAATTINRQFITKVQLGNGKIYEGLLPNIYGLRGKFYPLIYGGDAPNTKAGADGSISRFCVKDALEEDLIKGKIVLCDGPMDGAGDGAILGGAAGIVLTGKKVDDEQLGPYPVPASFVGLEENSDIYKYINSTRNATATIWKSEEISDVLAPYVPSYSSRGPNPINPNILKPDLAAPGTYILAAYPPSGGGGRAGYYIDTGTSMACPHATATAAYVKSFHPKWSPAAIQSALITTAKPMSAKTSPDAEFAYGAGLINPSRAPYPGLVYDLDEQDYINFLCSQGYSGKLLQAITRDKTSCSSKSNNGTANDLNYPSFALSIKDPKFVNGVFHRTVTNVGSSKSTYRANIVAPLGLKINVNPSVLSFTSLEQKKSFVVTIKGPIEKSNLVSASLVWDDGAFQVRSPIVVYVAV